MFSVLQTEFYRLFVNLDRLLMNKSNVGRGNTVFDFWEWLHRATNALISVRTKPGF